MESIETRMEKKCMKLRDEYQSQCLKYQKFYSIIRPTTIPTNCEQIKTEYIGNMCNFYTGDLADTRENHYEYFYGLS